MKKNFFIIFILFCVSLFSHAQKNSDTSLDYSFHIGLNGSVNKNIDSFKSDIQPAYLPFIGFNVYRQPVDKLKLGAGLYYSVKGSNIGSNAKTYRFRYIAMQFTARYYITPWFDLSAGIEPSYLLFARYTNAEVKTNITDHYKSMELSLPIGAEIYLRKHFSLGFTYNIPNSLDHYSSFKIGINYFFNPDHLSDQLNAKKNRAYAEIGRMKNSVLLVRLFTNQTRIESLEPAGKEDVANELKKSSDQMNKSIIKAFRTKFNFCPVYFFNENNSLNVRKGNFHGIFMNDSLLADSSIVPDVSRYYLAEFSEEASAGAQTDELPDSVKNNPGYSSQSSTSIGNTQLNMYGLRLMDPAFKQLESPFPSFVRINEGLTTRKYFEVIELMNKKLLYFYNKSVTASKSH